MYVQVIFSILQSVYFGYFKSMSDTFNSYLEKYFFDKKQTYFLLITQTGQHFDDIISQGVGCLPFIVNRSVILTCIKLYYKSVVPCLPLNKHSHAQNPSYS